jgi:hypothetical protein
MGVGDLEPLGNEREFGKSVGDLLLAFQRGRVDRASSDLVAVDGTFDDIGRQADLRSKLHRVLMAIVADPAVDLVDCAQHGFQHLRVLLGDRTRGHVEGDVRRETGPVDDQSRIESDFGCSVVGVPDHPGIHRAALECGARIRGREVGRHDVVIGEAVGFQRSDQQIVDVRSLVERDALALEICHRPDRAVLGDDDGLVFRRRRLIAGIDDVGACGLREDRWRFPDQAEIGGPDIQRFEQLRAGLKLRPRHRPADRR